MPLHFLFPQDPLDPRREDEHFTPYRAEVRQAGFRTSIVPDAVFRGEGTLTGIGADDVVVYRGWMVNAVEYERFVSAVESAGARTLTSLDQYLLTHHLPNWYTRIREFTPETVVVSADADLEAELRHLGWPAFFLKDYVKSLKTAKGSLITDPAEAGRVVEDMRRFRGEIEGGICIRRVEALRPETECRYFVVGGRAAGPEGSTVPDIVRAVAGRIASPFFTVDVALNDSDVYRVVELGDGQVSDAVGWALADVVRLWTQTA